MRILYAGSLTPQGYIATTAGRMREIQSLGHEVIPVDSCTYDRMEGKVLSSIGQRLRFGVGIIAMNRDIVRGSRAGSPEVLWIEKGTNIFPGTLAAVRRHGIRCVIHYTPDPSLITHRSRHFLKAIPLYDLLVTTKRYEVADLRRLGARRILCQFPSYDLCTHRPEIPDEREAEAFRSDVVFVGTYNKGRERFLRPLAEQPVDLAIWGADWERCWDPVLRRCVRGATLGGRRYALALSCSRIGLGLLNMLHPDRSTTRSLEIPACGSLLLAERTEEHAELFAEGREAELFSSEAELLDKVSYYLQHEERRRLIAAAGYRRVVDGGHSSRERVIEILSEITTRLL